MHIFDQKAEKPAPKGRVFLFFRDFPYYRGAGGGAAVPVFSKKYTFLDFILLTVIYIFGIINTGIMSFFVVFLRIFSVKGHFSVKCTFWKLRKRGKKGRR